MQKTPERLLSQGFCESGGEEGIRTLDTVSCIHTFQACSFNRSDTSPDLIKLFSLSRGANVVESFSFGKGFFQNFHVLKGHGHACPSNRAKPPIYKALSPPFTVAPQHTGPQAPGLTGQSALALYLAAEAE